MTSNNISQIISEIRSELDSFNIQSKNLSRFKKDNESDMEYLSFVNGDGGHYVKFLALLTKKLQPKNIVELGNREGLSTLAFYDQLPPQSKFTTIDILEDVRYCPEEMFNDDRVTFITGDVGSLDVLKKVPDQIDILFTDTIHYYFQLKDEFEIYQHLLSDKAIVAIDDIHLNDKGRFWEEVQFTKWDLTELCHDSGWGLFLFERKQPATFEERWKAILEATSRIWERKYRELYIKDQANADRRIINIIKRRVRQHPKVYQTLLWFYLRLKKLVK